MAGTNQVTGNLRYVSDLTADDWSLWRTTTHSAERIDHLACELDGFAHANRIHHQIRQFLTRLEDVPQRRRLKMALPKHSAWDAPIAIT